MSVDLPAACASLEVHAVLREEHDSEESIAASTTITESGMEMQINDESETHDFNCVSPSSSICHSATFDMGGENDWEVLDTSQFNPSDEILLMSSPPFELAHLPLQQRKKTIRRMKTKNDAYVRPKGRKPRPGWWERMARREAVMAAMSADPVEQNSVA